MEFFFKSFVIFRQSETLESTMMRPPEPPVTTSSKEVDAKKDLEKNNNVLIDCDDLESVEDFDEKIIYVRTKKVGYLIGTSGRTIRGFENNSGAKIDILKPNSAADETPILLSGTSDSVRNVLRMIIDLYHLNNLSSALWQHLRNKRTDNVEEKSEDAICGHEEMRVRASFVETMEKTIMAIETETGAHVEIGREPEDDLGYLQIGIIGTATQSYNATEKLKAMYENFLKKPKEENENRLDPFNEQGKLNKATPRCLTEFENYKENLIISKGVTITHAILQPICKLNGVMMETMKTEDETEIVVSGMELNVKRAKLQLQHNFS